MDAVEKEMVAGKKTGAVMEKNRETDKEIIVVMVREMVVAADKAKGRASSYSEAWPCIYFAGRFTLTTGQLARITTCSIVLPIIAFSGSFSFEWWAITIRSASLLLANFTISM